MIFPDAFKRQGESDSGEEAVVRSGFNICICFNKLVAIMTTKTVRVKWQRIA